MTGREKSYFHRGGDEPLLGATIPEHFADIVERFPEHEAVVSLPQQKRLNYREFSESVDQLARGLLAAGFGKGDRIGVWSTDNFEWLLLQMATARIGAILVNINPAYGTRELGYALQQTEIQGVFTIPAFRHSFYLEMLVELIPELTKNNTELNNPDFPCLRHIIVYDPADPVNTPRSHPGIMIWPDIIDLATTISMEELNKVTDSCDRDDPINIQYTSGTTGFPKAVILTHHNLLNNAYFSARAMHFTEADRLCIPVPFYHCFGMVLANLVCISVGACMVIPSEHFDAPAVLHAIEAEKCTAVHGVPTMFIAELEHPDFKKYELGSLRTGIMAGAPCPAALRKRVIKDMHCPEILIGYGETEASPLTHLTTSVS